LAAPVAAQAADERADLALVLAVDVSGSVDAGRYALQMNGIANAFEDRTAQILGGPHGAMLVALVEWANKPTLSVPWTLLTSREDVRRFADTVRHTPRAENGFTCMASALRNIADKLLTRLPVPAERLVVDVSGDGADNCNRASVDSVRDDLVAADVTVNGLPILEGDEAATLEDWYRTHVIGGPDSFLIPAHGSADFERAIRRKFEVEISQRAPEWFATR
jgi:Protein of unknown function (DUF1194)